MRKVLGRVSVVMLLALSLAFSACSKSGNTGNANASNTGAAGATATPGGGAEDGKPTAALRAYFEASIRKDSAAARRYLSAGTMRLVEDNAKQSGKTVEEAMEEGARRTSMTALPELSNEKISGDTATVDANHRGETLTMLMVREGGEWKVALDKTLQNVGIPTDGSGDGGQGDGDHGGRDEK